LVNYAAAAANPALALATLPRRFAKEANASLERICAFLLEFALIFN